VGTLVLIVGFILVAWLVSFLSWIWLLVLGFQRHWAWGCALVAPTVLSIVTLFLSPEMQRVLLPVAWAVSLLSFIVLIVFIVVAWPEAKRPFFWLLGSTCAAILVLFGTIFFAASKAQEIRSMLEARGINTSAWDRAGGLRPNPAQPGAGWRTQNSRDENPSPPPPAPVFSSRLPPPKAGQREPPKPGIYYLLTRVSKRTPRGIQNGFPGERVILLNRLPGGKMRVTVGNADFEVEASQLTDDIDIARDAEKQDFIQHGGQL
jgi:hypothetical protein